MPIASGTRLGPYEVVSALGEGGMGEVYRARDTRLGRDVAVKVLPAQVAADADRQSRFEREARAVAKLNHPNILGLYDVGSQDGLRYIVTELVEGEPVRGPMPPRRLVDVGAQIADGLSAAHAAGIVHRDLKPDNIFVGRDGRVKILDFGLASDFPDAAEGAGLTRSGTSPGTVLGTVAYMSPEQARGLQADARSDQFSLGLVLYELACGRQAFVRDSSVQTLSAIIEAEPDLTPLARLPAPLRWIIERCLSKQPEERYGSTLDLARDLRQLRDRHSELSQSGVTDLVAPPVRRRRWPVAAGALGLLALVLVGAFSIGRDSGVALDAYHFVPFAVDAGVQTMPAWSPDGERLAYSREVDGYFQIFARQLSQSTPIQLTSLDADCLYPTWDPTGTRIYFQRARTSSAIAAVAATGEVWVVSGAGGAPERVSEDTTAFAVAPDGNVLVFAKPGETHGTIALWRRDLKSGATRLLLTLPDQYRSLPSSSGLRFSRDGSRLALVSSDYTELVVIPSPLAPTGAGTPRRVRLTPAGGGALFIMGFNWMPDGRRVILELRDPRGGDKSVWLGDLDTGTATRVTATMQWETTPAASPDGSRVAFSATPLDWDILEVDLPSGRSRPLVASSRYDGWGDWMPDGSGIIYSTQRTGRFEIWQENLRDHSRHAVITPEAFPEGPSFFLVQGTVSADGRSIAYVRYTNGEERIYVSAMGGSRPVQLTTAAQSGREDSPAWSRDGRWIVFRRDGHLMKALASGGTEGTVLTDDVGRDAEGGQTHWMPDGRSVVYRGLEGLKQVPVDGGPPQVITRELPTLWDLSPDGRVVYAIVERERRRIDLVTIDVASGAVRTLTSLGRRPASPDYAGYPDTLRALRVSPDGTRLMYSLLNPTADIWMLEGFTQPSRSWWPFGK